MGTINLLDCCKLARALAEPILRLNQNPEFAQKIRVAALTRAQDRYPQERTISQILEYLKLKATSSVSPTQIGV